MASPTRPPTLLTLARRALTGEAALARGETLLLAVSGGPDSMALLDVAARLAPKVGLRVVAHGVDHGLRAEAGAELDLAERHAAALGVPFARTRVSVARGGDLQARARHARHEALASAARVEGASAIATAHHADDRAETLLLRLLRGAGPRGLAVLPPRAPSIIAGGPSLVRPLLRARRADILTHLTRHGVRSASDPSNDDPRFTRVRVRRELLPLLETLNPGIVRHLEALADGMGELFQEATPGLERLGFARATETAIRDLVLARQKGSPLPGRVWLPGGLVLCSEDPENFSRSKGSRQRVPKTMVPVDNAPPHGQAQNRPNSGESDPR